MRESW
ncbi:valine--tRNA ligase, partial [Chlamydia psittaci C6/98]